MKTLSRNQFRILLALSVVTLIASWVAGSLDAWLLPQPLLDYQKAQQGTCPIGSGLVVGALAIPGLIAGLLAIVGLFRFWPSARWLSVAAWGYMLVWQCFTPWPTLSNAVSATLSDLSILLAGAVLALIYFSPAAEWFQGKPEGQADQSLGSIDQTKS